jgi:hypothetical protein
MLNWQALLLLLRRTVIAPKKNTMRWRPMMLTSVLREAISLKQDCQVSFVKELKVLRRAYVRLLLDTSF